MIHEFTTSRGLKVIGVESHKSPVVSVQIWTRNGSADERKGDEGLSHFIEHLVFKGTKSFKAGEIAARVEACGGEINAYTSFDQTVYYITISKQFYKEALQIIADMVSTPTFDSTEVDREREVVIEEIKRSHDSLGRRASRNLFEQFYGGHPYSVPVIGYEKNIQDVPVERLRSFFAERYVADNMFLVVTGDFDATTFPADVKAVTSEVSERAAQKPTRMHPTKLASKKVFVEESKFEEAVFYIVWPGIQILHADLAALECLMLILGQGASSRLYGKLRLEQNLVNSIGAGLWSPSQADGFLSVSGSLNPKHMDAAFTEIKTCLTELLDKGVSREELDKAKINFLSEEAYTMETVGGLARKYGGNFEAVQDLQFHEKFHQSLAEVTKVDVLNVARKYLNPQILLMTAMVPGEKQKVEELFRNWTFVCPKEMVPVAGKAENQKRAPARAAGAVSQVESHKLSNGLRIFSRNSLESPIYNLRLAFLGGAQVVPENLAGLAELSGRIWSSQTKRNSEQKLRELTDGMASSLYSYSGRNTLGLVVDGLSEFEANLASLFEEVLMQFDVQSSILAREKISILESLRSRKDSPATIAVQWFQKMIFQNHPYAIDPLGSEETLARITAKDVESYLKQIINPNGAVVAVSGDFQLESWKQALSKLESGDKKTVPLIQPALSLQENIYHFEKLDKEQTHIICGVQGLTLDSPERYTLQVLEAVLSGQGGRLFIELRDKASLAYSVSPMKMEGLGAGYFATYIGCSPGKVDTAIEMMQEELQKMASTLISHEELLRAQNYLIGGHDIGLQKNSSVASSIAFNEIYGLSYQEIYNYELKIRAVNSEDVQSLAKKLFSQPHALSVVGPTEPTSRPKKSFL